MAVVSDCWLQPPDRLLCAVCTMTCCWPSPPAHRRAKSRPNFHCAMWMWLAHRALPDLRGPNAGPSSSCAHEQTAQLLTYVFLVAGTSRPRGGLSGLEIAAMHQVAALTTDNLGASSCPPAIAGAAAGARSPTRRPATRRPRACGREVARKAVRSARDIENVRRRFAATVGDGCHFVFPLCHCLNRFGADDACAWLGEAMAVPPRPALLVLLIRWI